MRKFITVGFPLLVTAFFFCGVLPAMGAKHQQAISMSNGMPSGDHETLNFHGKDMCTQVCDPYDPLTECNVVDVPEYGTAQITYVSGRKVKVSELTVFDSCAGFGENDSAEIWLPYEANGYYVYARALGKPAKVNKNGLDYTPRSIIFQNATENNPTIYTLFGDVANPEEIETVFPLGLIGKGDFVWNDTYVDGGVNLVRFDSEPEGKGKGKTQGKDITNMFMWSGCVYQTILDTNEDGVVDNLDVPVEYDTDGTEGISDAEFQNWLNANLYGFVFPELPLDYDTNGDGVVDNLDVPVEYNTDGIPGISDAEFANWIIATFGISYDDLWIQLWSCYDQEWVFTIADLVYQDQVVINDGIKNLQIRFYPVDTTTFPEKPPVEE